MENKKKIFVTGGTGFLGSYLLRYLVQNEPADIIALKRPNSPMDLVADIVEEVEWVEGDILEVATLEDLMKGVDQVYHAAAIVSYNRKDRTALFKVNVEGTANIVNLALHHQVEKLVHISSIAALGRTAKDYQVNEKAKWQRSKWNTQYAISKHQAEMEIWRGVAEGLNAATVNPSIILGSGFWEKGTCRFFMNGWKNFKFYTQGGTGFVDVRDVAKAAIKLMESDITAERFIINSENLTFETMMKTISTALDKKLPSIKVTPFIRETAWRAAAVQAALTGKRPFITKETARHSAKRYFYQNDKSIEQLGINYIPVKETIQATCQQLKAAATEEFKPMVLPLV